MIAVPEENILRLAHTCKDSNLFIGIRLGTYGKNCCLGISYSPFGSSHVRGNSCTQVFISGVPTACIHSCSCFFFLFGFSQPGV